MDPTKVRTSAWLRIAIAVTCALPAATAPAFTVQPQESGKRLYRSVSRYSGTVAPVREDLAAVVARGRPRAAGRIVSRPSSMSAMGVTPGPDLQFDTIPYCNLNRPDSAIAAGPAHLVTAVNFCLQVQDLDGQNPSLVGLAGFFPDDPTGSIGDPRLIYDQASGRFILGALGFDYPGQRSYADIAVSATSDPNGPWNKYSINVVRNGPSGLEQMDFDSLGVDGQAIYLTARTRDFATVNFQGNRMLILDKAQAMAGGALTPIIVDDLQLPAPFSGPAEIVKPVEPMDPVTPTTLSYFLTTAGNSNVALYSVSDPLGTSGGPTFTGTAIPIPAWANSGDAPQPGGPPVLQQQAGWPLHKTTIRNGLIWSCQSPSATGIAGDRAGIVVYKFDPVTAALVEVHTISDPSLWFYLPAVVPDVTGNAVVTFAASDAGHFASIYHARYDVGTGAFDAPVLTTAGASSFSSKDPQSGEAWGDYSDAAPDVASGGRAVWTHGELPVTRTTWKMRAARIPSTLRPIIGVSATSLPFGTLCPGETKDLVLQVLNTGTADLHVSSIARTSGSTQFALVPGPPIPTTIPPGSHVDYTIRFTPVLPVGSRTASFRIASDDPLTPTLDVQTTGTLEAATVNLSPCPLDFGSVCQEDGAGHLRTLQVCNGSSHCPLSVSGIAVSGSEFTVVGPTVFTVAPGTCTGVTVQFTPASAGLKSTTLTVTSDAGPATCQLRGATATASIDVPPDVAFPPTVIQSVGACQSNQPFPISNTGQCNLTINSIALGGADAGDDKLVGLPSFPIVLQPGHVVGEGDFQIGFAPTVVDRDRQASLTVSYVSDPVSGATASTVRSLCGEGVRTGARVLVTAGGAPVASVDKLMLKRVNSNRNKDRVDTIDVAQDAPLQSVTPAAPCASFQFHREYGTVSNPIQLLPGSYLVTVNTKIAGKMQSKTVAFDVGTCGFDATIVVDF